MREVVLVIKEQVINYPISQQHKIDERAVIHPTAKIAEDVTIGPWTIIGPYVEIGAGTTIGPHVVIKQHTKIGKQNKIHQFASLGEDPQHFGYKGEVTWLEMGDHNVVREFCTINRGTVDGGGITKIAHHNYMMSYVHIAHDCLIGNHTLFVNNASLAGHVQVDDYAMIGVFVGLHQYCKVGAYSFVSQAAMVRKDVLPYVLVVGHDPAVSGLNIVGLKRRGFSEETIRHLRHAYNIIFRSGLTVKDAIAELEPYVATCPEVQALIDGLRSSTRGIVR